MSSRSEPLVHWEGLKNKRTRIQIRKAQSSGCRGNLQQAPSLALSLSRVGAKTCQARLPLPSPALCSSAGTQERGKGTKRHLRPIRWALQAWAPTTSFREMTPLPLLAQSKAYSLRVEMPSGFLQWSQSNHVGTG